MQPDAGCARTDKPSWLHVLRYCQFRNESVHCFTRRVFRHILLRNDIRTSVIRPVQLHWRNNYHLVWCRKRRLFIHVQRLCDVWNSNPHLRDYWHFRNYDGIHFVQPQLDWPLRNSAAVDGLERLCRLCADSLQCVRSKLSGAVYSEPLECGADSWQLGPLPSDSVRCSLRRCQINWQQHLHVRPSDKCLFDRHEEHGLLWHLPVESNSSIWGDVHSDQWIPIHSCFDILLRILNCSQPRLGQFDYESTRLLLFGVSKHWSEPFYCHTTRMHRHLLLQHGYWPNSRFVWLQWRFNCSSFRYYHRAVHPYIDRFPDIRCLNRHLRYHWLDIFFEWLVHVQSRLEGPLCGCDHHHQLPNSKSNNSVRYWWCKLTSRAHARPLAFYPLNWSNLPSTRISHGECR